MSAKPEHLAPGVLARFAQVAIGFVFLAAVLFLAAGRLDWPWAWAFLAIYFVDVVINASFLLRGGQATIAERGRPGRMRTWDARVSAVWGVAQSLALPLIAGLDQRFGWSPPQGLGLHLAGAAVFSAGLALFGWAMVVNAYFSTAVRIQSERGQTVCRSGPYRMVRHPGYAGAILQSLGIPLLLGSWPALIPAAVAIAAITLRTALEDRTLNAELPGYADYAQEVRYRLIPRVW